MTPEERAFEIFVKDCPHDGDGGRFRCECEICVREAICAAVEEEREACAKLVDDHWKDTGPAMLSALIRKRGTE